MLGDDNSVVAVVVLPALVLVAGAMVEDETGERIAALEARVAELEAELAAETDGNDDS